MDNEFDIEKRKRINRLKKMIVRGTISLLLLFALSTFILLVRVYSLSHEVKELKAYIEGESVSVEDNVSLDIPSPSLNIVYEDNVYGISSETEQEMEDPYEDYRKVCLTFDDGPSVYTDDILDILDDYGVKATFFVNGHPGFEDEYRRIVDEGHTIGMHSFSHSYKDVYSNLDSFADDLYQIQSYIKETTGVDCVYYRFPGGSSNTVGNMDMKECISYLNAKGITYYDWNVSSQDASSREQSVNSLVDNVISQIDENSAGTIVVLMHDSQDKHTTVEALPIILEKLADMEDVVMLPISDDITPIQHVTISAED